MNKVYRIIIIALTLFIILITLLLYYNGLLTRMNNNNLVLIIIKGSALMQRNDPQPFIITAPLVTQAIAVSFSSGNYDGIPVVVYKAGIVSMPYGMTLMNALNGTTMIINMSSSTFTGITIYAANITATALGITITITPQNVATLSILAAIVSELIPLANVQIYAYYVNATSVSFKNLNIIIK